MQYTDQDIYDFLSVIVAENGEATGQTIRGTEWGPTERTISNRFGSVGEALSEAGIKPDGYNECIDCGGYFMHIGKHISRKECSLPEITEQQWDLIVGTVLGDGYVTPNSAGNPTFGVSMTEKEFIHWLNNELSPLSNCICRDEFSNKRDQYKFDTTPHKKFRQIRSWYDGGEKRFPENLKLNRVRLKIWYVTDGGNSNGYPSITSHNESDRSDFLLSLFDGIPFDVRWKNYEIHVSSDTVDKFFEYIGSPPPGFEYKWPEEYK